MFVIWIACLFVAGFNALISCGLIFGGNAARTALCLSIEKRRSEAAKRSNNLDGWRTKTVGALMVVLAVVLRGG